MFISALREQKAWETRQAKRIKEANIRGTVSEVVVTVASSLA